MRVQAAPMDHLGWLVSRTQFAPTHGCRAIEVVRPNGTIAGMVAYDMWTLNSVQCHMAVDSPTAWRVLLGPAFEYPFLEAGRGLLLGIIPASNLRSVHLTQRLGFREAYRVRDGWDVGEDLIVFEMRRDECRHLRRH